MFTTSSLMTVLLLTLSAMTSALPYHVKKDTCSAPSTFTISGFSTYYPSSDNTAQTPHLNFKFGDSSTNSTISCTLAGTSEAGTFTQCSDPLVSFYYSGTQSSPSGNLNITQEIPGCTGVNKRDSASMGSVYVSEYCYPSQVPFGPGTACQTPSVSLTGEF